jgi:hypothetical protein
VTKRMFEFAYWACFLMWSLSMFFAPPHKDGGLFLVGMLVCHVGVRVCDLEEARGGGSGDA